MSTESTQTSVKELKPEQLTKLQELLSAFNQSKLVLADSLLSQKDAMEKVEAHRLDFASMEKSLIEEYGENVSINIQTGALTYK
jgi:hypothetical protein|tara:strand:+ start:1053 stop:1304 length:252 start_codon:yes stop_codon:yes gene_type:complete